MIFVFNGDADGICALQQLCLAEELAQPPVLVTGVKRDTLLLKNISDVKSTSVTVLDIEIEKNHLALEKLLSQGCHVRWFDHHKSKSDTLLIHENLQCWIDTSSSVNTSWIVNQFLNEQHQLWAAVGLFGDNIHQTAIDICVKAKLAKNDITLLTELGQALNYNSYGLKIEDLYINPSELWKRIAKFANPLDFIKQDTLCRELFLRRQQDLEKALQLHIPFNNTLVLPHQPWAQRVIGEVGHYLAQQEPSIAHCVAVDNGQDGFVVSVRAPLVSASGAVELCSRYETGGGRAGAAGINHLPKNLFAEFIKHFEKAF